MTNVNVNLNVTGANTFSDVQTIASLAPGANTTVSFASFSPTTVGANAVDVTLASDDFSGNNSKSVSQTVSGNAYTYAYGTTSSGGVGFNGFSGDFVAKFNTSTPTTVNQVQVTFTSGGNAYKIGIWDATGAAGNPGALLWESVGLVTATGVATIPVSPAVAVSGDFYVGVRQTGTVNVGFGYQTETPIRGGTFFFTSPSGGATWTDFAPNNSFKFMVEPKLTLSDDIGVANIVSPANSSTIDLCGDIFPSANISNFGANNQTNINVTFTIKQAGTTVYTNTKTIASLNSGVSQIVDFAAVPLGLGTYTSECTTSLSGDLDNTNDLVTNTFNIVQNNFATSTAYKYANSYACPATTPIPPATYSWVTQTTNEVSWSLADGDDNFQILTLPFPFSFYGITYTKIYVSSNGWASFSDPTALTLAQQRTPVTIPTAGGLENYIAGAFNDMDMTPATYTDAHLYYGGDATQFVMTWWHAHDFGSTTDFITFQIILKPNGSIKLQFNDTETTTPLPTNITNFSGVGIENATGAEGMKYRYLATGAPMFGSPMAVDFVTVAPLPLTLLSFDAQNSGTSNILSWRTANEQNVSHFMVQRSNDGIKFMDLTTLNTSIKPAATNDYSFSDRTLLDKANYYRLKMVDRDAHSVYSEIRLVNTKSLLNNFNVYPNPSSDFLNIAFDLKENSACEIQIFDVFGKQVFSQKKSCNKEQNLIQLNIEDWIAGVYAIKIIANESVLSSQKFTKM